ncbi:hypothetical protein NV379_01785 [Paenibacillus sp. N1-5-1-14]|nr:hypothetical protein [Paenibacillus radicibacter]
METVNLLKDTTNEKNAITFKELYQDIINEIRIYERRGELDELMKQKVTLSFNDLNGSVLGGYCTLFVGWLESGSVHIVGSLSDIYEHKIQ